MLILRSVMLESSYSDVGFVLFGYETLTRLSSLVSLQPCRPQIGGLVKTDSDPTRTAELSTLHITGHVTGWMSSRQDGDDIVTLRRGSLPGELLKHVFDSNHLK
jgi:hypothetical protein